jgi:predicted DNA-binding protein (UPF0251 family)
VRDERAAARLRDVAWVREEPAQRRLVPMLPMRPATQGEQNTAWETPGAPLPEKKPVQSVGVRKSTVQVPVSSMAFYRRYTELLLRRYMQVSLRMGRVPSVLGNCMFRGKVSSYRVQSFEDAVIFVYDVERCIKKLEASDRELVARVALQEYTQAEAAELLGLSVRTVVRRYGEAVDQLTRMFLENELLEVGPLFDGQ